MATPWDPNSSNAVSKLAVSGGTVYASGHFHTIGGQPRNYIAALDAATGSATAWDPNADDFVSALAVDGTTVYAGGNFTSIGGQPRNRLAALDATNGSAAAWALNANSFSYALAVSGSKVYAGGEFSTIAGLWHPGIACFEKPAVSAVPEPGPPAGLLLSLLSPNPARGRADFEFTLAHHARVRLLVLDVQGRLVARLLDQEQSAGSHWTRWEPAESGDAAAGIYFVRLDAGGRSVARRFVLLR
jgi:hypothetical protein